MVCMETRSLKFIATACGGELLSGAGQTPVRRVCTDSRQAQAGDLFFALRGEHFDGHNFLDDAARKGAVAVVVEVGREKGEGRKEKAGLPGRPALALRTSHLGCAVVAVADTRKALGRLAAEYRKDFGLPITAIGGSNGKTTTKDLVASGVKQKLATETRKDFGLRMKAIGGSNGKTTTKSLGASVGKQKLAPEYRKDFGLPITAIGGSNGKTKSFRY